MRIAFFINALYNSGGTERVSTVIANELAKDVSNQVFMISRLKSDPFFDLSPNVKYLYLSSKMESHYLNYFKYVIKIAGIIKKYKIDKWIDVCSAMSLMSIPAKMLVKFDIYTWEHFNLTVEWNPITNKLARYLSCRFARKVIVLTNTDKQLFEEKYNASNVVCIPNPITTAICNPVDVVNNRTVISIGRFTSQKGFDMLLKIWDKTESRNKGWKLLIVGDGEERASLEKQIEKANIKDSVELAFPTKNIEEIYQKAALFVMSSRFEGLPLVLLEAIAQGLPIISFDCETGPRDVIENERNGYLINCFDLNLFANRIDLLCRDTKKREMFSKNSIRKSVIFDINEILKMWNSIFDD